MANCEVLPPLVFTDVTATSGIDLTIDQQPPRTGSGISVIYWDDDAYPDLLISGGVTSPIALYRNEGNMMFSLVPKEESGVWFVEGDPRGFSVADYDNDGDTDFFVGNWAEDTLSYLFRNDDGKFKKLSKTIGIEVLGDATGGSWGDLDNDGDLELYVGRYWGKQNHLFRNDGNGNFTDITFAAGLDQDNLESETLTFQSMWVDIDRDGLVDLFEMNDRCYNGFAHNRVWINENGMLVDKSEDFGLDLCYDAMGIGLNDYDRDGFFDLFLTNVPDGHFMLKGGCGKYSDQTGATGVLSEQWGWGVVFDDLNHDRFPDLYVAHSGYVNFIDSNRLYQGKAGGEFEDVAMLSDAHLGDQNSAVVVRADFDLDGDQDLVVGGIQGDSHAVLRNDSVVLNHVVVELVGTVSNRDGIGAWVEVFAGGSWERRPRTSSEAFGGNHDPGLLFALGEAEEVDRIVVHWPSGISEMVEGVSANSRLTVEEGTGAPWSIPLWSERCGDLVDNDCNGEVDEGFELGDSCVVGLGACEASGKMVCTWDRLGSVCDGEPGTPVEELLGDGIDNDCDGQIDEDEGRPLCGGVLELCGDLVDNDCDGSVDEGFEEVDTVCSISVLECEVFGTWRCETGSASLFCDAEFPVVQPERCGDFVDNDCDGQVDEGFPAGESCQLGTGACEREGLFVCNSEGTNVLCDVEPGLPEHEMCGDGVDNDCDGSVDEGFPVGTACVIKGCQVPGIWGCSDSGISVTCIPDEQIPPERCGDQLDNDCDGETDEGFTEGGLCWVGEGTCRRKGTLECNGDGSAVECMGTQGLPGVEIMHDGLDNDCDGMTDEGSEDSGFPLSEDLVEESPRTSTNVTVPLEDAPAGESRGGCATGKNQQPLSIFLVLLLVFAGLHRPGLSDD